MMEKTYAKMRSKLASIYWPDSVDSSIGSSGSAGSSSGNANGSRNYVDPWDLENYAYIRRHSVALPPPPPEEEIIQQQPIYQTTRRRRAGSRYTGPSDTDLYDSNYQYAAAREPGYHAPGSVEEIYFGSSDLSATLRRAAAAATMRKNSSSGRLYDYSRRPPLAESTQQQQQPIYETRQELLQLDDDVDYEDEFACPVGVRSSYYDTPLPLYAKLSDIEQAEALEEIRRREMAMTSRHRGKGTVTRSRNYPGR
uniref:Uncharacterized protein n=1 Tax=Trichogramma kaykai TaxID=54128 RepID=A0ABD2XBH8_9HYME